MKDYDHVILWLDYFNKNLSKRKGRRIKRESAIYDPTITEIIDAAKLAGYDDINDEKINNQARFPRRSFVKSSYIMISRKQTEKKSAIIKTIGEKMLQKRNKQKSVK